MKHTSRWSVRIAHIAGIDVRVHVTFLILVALFATPYAGGPPVAENLAFLALVCVCILAHEFAHSLVARQRGAVVHEILLLPIGGVSKLEHLPESPSDEFTIAIVGPVASVAIGAFAALVALAARVPLVPVDLAAGPFLERIVWFNLIVGAFNLLPAFPLDGGRVLRSLLERRFDLETATRRAARIGRSLAIVLGVVGVVTDVWLVLIAIFVYFGATAEEAFTLVHVRVKGHRVCDAMLPDPATIEADATVADLRPAAQPAVRTAAQRWVPVLEHGRYHGMLDVHALHGATGDEPVRPHVFPCEPIRPDDALEDALERLETERLRALPVIGSGRIVGLLRMEDVADLAARLSPPEGSTTSA